MELGLKGKVALVTGSSRGIGRGIALAFAEEGCDLLLTGRDAQALQEVATSIRGKGRKAAVCVLDLREPSAAETLVETVQRELGGLDILVNAGRDRRHQWTQAGEAFHHRQFGQCRGCRLHQVLGRPRQGGRRAGQLHPSLPGRDRAAVAAHPRRGRADRGARGRHLHHLLAGSLAAWRHLGSRRRRDSRAVIACPGRSAATQISLRNLRTLDCVVMRCRPGTVPARDGPGSAAHRSALHRIRDTRISIP